VMQVSFDPVLLVLSINPHHSSYGLLTSQNSQVKRPLTPLSVTPSPNWPV
jgi:hypothetical protein